MTVLQYGNTKTFFIRGSSGALLVDTDYAGTLPAFYRAAKAQGIRMPDISYVLATHYHPDHMGLIGALMQQGVRLLLMDVQLAHVHFSDRIFARDRLSFQPVDETAAAVISCAESRDFLLRMGIRGEILHTPSHSPDSVTLVLDDGDCFAGDLEPLSYLEAYTENEALRQDWTLLLSRSPKRVFFAHAPETVMG
ncbi:MAG: MBL fold metallo-hydrolase [Oscillospiraceae bacterium]|nr:MBL fold metallo-hydrolase [Oscillospiraceae bacterium]